MSGANASVARMKTCSKCGEDKPSSDFGKNGTKADGLQTYCTACNRIRMAAYYGADRAAQIARNRRFRRQGAERLLSHLRIHPCVDCGETDPVVLEFDHVRGTKEGTITRMAALGYSWPVIVAEMEKCEVRCANCHRRATARRCQGFRYQMASTIIPR